ncbi:MAG: Gfo/Idh/MocA family oxidoreductase [Candidatus Zixiibacteriota bacterium]
MTKKRIVRLGLSGLGGFSVVIAEAIRRSKNAELISCFDVMPERREATRKKYNCDEEQTYEDLLKRDDIDGVVLVTPNAVHAEQTLLAVQYNKHVFVEKPIANTISDGEQMIEACDKAGVVLMVGHMMRRYSGNRKVKELVDGGAIGKPVMAEANISDKQGWQLTPDKFRWRGDDLGCPGGALMTMGVHQADMFNYVLGPIQSALAFFNKLYIPAEVEDVTATIFQFDSGVLGYLGCNYVSPTSNWLRIYGTEANLFRTTSPPSRPTFAEYLKDVPHADRYTRLELFEKGKNRPTRIPLPIGDPILEEIDEFAHCILTGERPETDGKGALAALRLIRAAIESARSGGKVKIGG